MEQVESLKTENKFKKTEAGEIPMEWGVASLGDISTEIYRYPTYYNIQYVERGIPEIRGELIKSNGNLETDMSLYRFISKDTAAQFPKTRMQEGDFVISVRGTMGKIGIVPNELEGANITANLIRVSPDRKRIFPLWLLQIFMSEKFQEQLNMASSSTTIKTIKAPELKSFKLAIPTFFEQKKIAEILSAVDSAIEKSNKVIEKTKELKRGLMQELLTGKRRVKVGSRKDEGESRYKKTKLGEIPEEWGVKRIEEIVEKIIDNRGKTPSLSAEGYELIEVNAIEADSKYPNYKKVTKYVDEKTYDEWFRDGHPEKNDILIPTVGTIGVSAILNENRGCIAQNIIAVRVTSEMFPDFFYYLTNSDIFIKQVNQVVMSAVQPSLKVPHFLKLTIQVPSYSEQRKIADILNGIDEEIEEETAQNNKLKDLKKGLMQVLLTGKIRVKIGRMKYEG